MLDTTSYTPRFKTLYRDKIRAALKEEFGYKNDMQIPRLDKIVLNIGCGSEAVRDSKKARSAQEDLSTIAGQKAVITKAKKSIAGFRVREEMPLGCKGYAARRSDVRIPRPSDHCCSAPRPRLPRRVGHVV